MNELVEYIRNNNFPVLFRYNDLLKTGLKKYLLNEFLVEAVKRKYIDNIYKDIYTLSRMYRRNLVCEGVLSQMIVPNSYVSLRYVLSDVLWIPESVYNITSITNGTNLLINTENFGSFKFINIYKNIPVAGIYIENSSIGNYKRATPLRALCDYVCLYEKKWDNIGYLEDHLRIMPESLENLREKDFDELQGVFKIHNIENFLIGIRKELGL